MLRRTKSGGDGRFGNQFIRNIAVSIIAEKFNLAVDYDFKELFDKLGIVLFIGQNEYDNEIILHESNYFEILNYDKLLSNLNTEDYLQNVEISRFLHNYLHSYKIRKRIIAFNPYKDRYNNNNNLYVHIRLSDVADYNPGINYYLNTIKTISYDKLYISTDDPSHNIIKEMLKHHPTAILINYDEINTFQFASTCKHIILSHGTFSAIIGYLAFFSTINYPEYVHQGYLDFKSKIWYLDIFRIEGWIERSVK